MLFWIGFALVSPMTVTVFIKPNCIWCTELLEKLQSLIEHTNIIVNPVDSSREDLTPFVEKYGKIAIPSILVGDRLIQGIPEESDLVSLILKHSFDGKTAEPRIHTFSCSITYSNLITHIINRIADTASPSGALFVIAGLPKDIPMQVFWRASEGFPIYIISDFKDLSDSDRAKLGALAANHENIRLGHLENPTSWFVATDEGFMKAQRLRDIILGAWSTTPGVAKTEISTSFLSAWQIAKRIDKKLMVQDELLSPNTVISEILML
jgi:glutaredoxin